MKTSIKLGVLGLGLSVAVTACVFGDKSKSKGPDSIATATKTTVKDSITKDTAGNTTAIKKDSTAAKKTETKKM